ncbi:hypothetical protein OEG84_18660 [Hoeflea sp. G2-23]|uniref:Uncharacterized protein n=1 Tax=Hoeflea algicola TaxID=2983763 RepID=A0ABT3ZEF7_9HYPH|nr:hypothetical protein [Hoeflea algicola]MCY0149674.1 hypothetical protein [Hoeflea algicola]
MHKITAHPEENSCLLSGCLKGTGLVVSCALFRAKANMNGE